MEKAIIRTCIDCASATFVNFHPSKIRCSDCQRLHVNSKRRKGGLNFKPIASVGKSLDRRRKLTDGERATIKRKHSSGQTINSIHREYPWVSKRLIQFVIFPERLKRLAENVKQEKRWNKYYTTEKRRDYQRSHRAHRKSIGLKP